MKKLVPLVYSAIMLMLLLLPPTFFYEVSAQIPSEVSGMKTDSWVHISLFFGFVMCWLTAEYSPKVVLTSTVLAAVSSEIIQGYVGRYPDLKDLACNLSGMALAYVTWVLLTRLKAVPVDVSTSTAIKQSHD